jgi:hypothetical protein
MLAAAYSMWQLCQKPYSFRVLATTAGDNITPPQQAFNWIARTYGTVEEIKRRGQVIVCIGHSKIGHLGIFVSAKIARKEHKEIIASFDMLTYLPPGLYEMRIEEDPDQAGEYAVKYIEKNMDDILALDDGLADEKAFLAVRQVSETADLFYRNMVSPWIRQANNDFFADTLRRIVREQFRIVQTDTDRAIETLPELRDGTTAHREALAMLDQAVAANGRELKPLEGALLERVKAVLHG